MKITHFLSRREIVCDFNGLGGKLKKLEAIEMITKEFQIRWESCNSNQITKPYWSTKKLLARFMFMMMKNLQRSM